MDFKKTILPGVQIISPNLFEDNRGSFCVSYIRELFVENNIPTHFQQENISISNKGVLRGLHFQSPPQAQGKLITVLKGSVLDVVVDIRQGSPTFGEYLTINLDDNNKSSVWIPEGFAHGFLSLKNNTIFNYKCTGKYDLKLEGGIVWNDSELNINWGIEKPIISEKDKALPTLKDFKSSFLF